MKVAESIIGRNNQSESVPDKPAAKTPRVRFDRHELAGSFGDIGTDLPLIAAMIPAAGLDAASVFIVFGAMQILTGVLYGLPMPMQPLKAMAVLVITQQLGANVLYGAGFAIGLVMFALALTGALNWLARVIPHCAVRGVQLGLGLQLGNLALQKYVPAMGLSGYVLAGLSFILVIALMGSRRLPPALPVIGLGIIYAVLFDLQPDLVASGTGIALPQFHVPAMTDITTGFLVLALPQLPLSLSNSVIATNKTLQDLYPERRIGIRKLGFTYAGANLIAPFLSGIPVCHGCGGLAGHYAFGARTGGSVLIYGSVYVLIGLFFSRVADHVVNVFPKPILGVILSFEALALMLFARDVASDRRDMTITLLVALMALALPQGFVVGLVTGTLLFYLSQRFAILR